MRAVRIDVPEVVVQAATHRHTTHEHEHEFEPQRGLPEPLPSGERILWQGAPDWLVLARECFHIRKLAIYFAILIAWRLESVIASGSTLREIAIAGGLVVALAAVALGLVTLMAWLSARTALYTITDRRVVMRVGIVLSVTFNLPFAKVEAAGLHPLARGHGDVALTLDAKDRIAYLHLWPHVRPWHVARTQPSLRCVADAGEVARILTAAWVEQRGDATVAVGDMAAALPAVRDFVAPRRAPRQDLPARTDHAIDVPQAA